MTDADEPEVTLTGPELAEWQRYQEHKAKSRQDGVEVGYRWASSMTDDIVRKHVAKVMESAAITLDSHKPSELFSQLAATQSAIDEIAGKKVTISMGERGMFERFTDRARRVVVLAQEQARGLNHNWIGSEHILLALVQEGEGVAAKSLKALHLNLDGLWAKVEECKPRGTDAPSGHIPFTPRTKHVMEFALREALQLGSKYVGTEHLLLGLIREGEGVAAQVLVDIGIGLGDVRREVLAQLQAATPPPTANALVDTTLLKSLRVYADAMDALLKTAGY